MSQWQVGGSLLSSYACAGIAGLSLVSLVGLGLWRRLFKALRETNRKKDEELSALRRALNDIRSELQEKDEALAVLKEKAAAMTHRLEEERRKLDNVQRQNHLLTEKLGDQDQALGAQQEELAHLGERHAQTLQLLEARTLELKGAEAYLTKADVLSGADVVSLLNTLNSEVYQTAAMVAEAFEFRVKNGQERTRTEEEAAAMEEVYISTGEIVGPRLLGLLRTAEHHQDPTIVQVAFQAGMAAYANWIVTSWDFEDPDDERGLSKIYGTIRQQEEQAVSGRWRALTRTHIPRMAEQELAMYFIDAFVNILLAAEVTQHPSELHEAIESRFAKRISIIVKGAERLRRAIGEEVTSCDFEIAYVSHESPFDPAQMDDTFASGFDTGRDEPEPVLCTTELGLARVVKVPGKVGQWEETVLLRPKIALKSGIDEMMAAE
ncbi:hypothetical protein LshimejAT787_0410210 [Lyophyllum shimeji]|uniref:Uncharacterized protein n=1 Tax=Lyophyllum shimeji TaxID=47721 RepID=A0A9P3PL75_LYOSH|nr:hypothetical protein LshimejAT787_0410210 [Lyophyllum shimeji]